MAEILKDTHFISGDTDPRFIVDTTTRKITTESPKVTLVQGDHNSERFTFQAPQIIDGHDMAECNRVQIHYINIDQKTKEQSKGVHIAEDFAVNAEEGVVTFSWPVPYTATEYEGTLSFAVRFSCVEDDQTKYAWNSALYSGISVTKGINNSAAEVAKYRDALEVLKDEIIDSMDEKFGAIEDALNNIIEMQNKLTGGASE